MRDEFARNINQHFSAPGLGSQPDRRRRALLLGSFSAAGLCALGLPLKAQANDLVVGKPAPPIVLHTLDGRNIATQDLIGKVVIVTFWATYCDPCREELPLLSAYAKSHMRHGLEVLGFCIDPPDNIDEVKKIAQNLSFPVGLTGTPYAGGYGRIWRMPVSFVIDRSGRLVDDGWKDDNPVWTTERLHRIIDPLLG